MRTELEEPRNVTLKERARLSMKAIRLAWKLPADAPIDTEQRNTLLAWPGWGALAPAFAPDASGFWADVSDELTDLLTDRALTAAADQVDTSFFTPPAITSLVFDLLTSVGFDCGRVLEPGCGSGRFIASAPAGLDVDWTGVELDPTAARIAALVNPTASIVARPLEKVAFPDGSFDAVVGNVPFSSATVWDSAYQSASLHEYFLLRAIAAVRPGGYVIAITSRHTMDGSYGVRRLTEDGLVELQAALRLPSGAFAGEGTDVVTDILLFRKTEAGKIAGGWDDVAENRPTRVNSWTTESPRLTVRDDMPGKTVGIPTEVNAYWRAHPDHVAGRMMVTSYSRNPLVVHSDNPAADIAAAVESVRSVLAPQSSRVLSEAPFDDVPLEDVDGRKEGSFHVIDDELRQVVGGVLQPMRNSEELKALVALRDAVTDLLALEADTSLPDSAIDEHRALTLSIYNAYAAKFGALNRGTLIEGREDTETGLPALSWRRPSMGGFRRDPDYSTTIAVEEYEQDTGEAGPAPILLRRVNRQAPRIERVDTPGEAIAVSLGETGTVDLTRIASLLGLRGEEAALDALGDLVYAEGGAVIAGRDYLSGNIREKLAAVRGALETDPELQRNVEALEAVLPADLGALEIRASLGAPWISADDVNQFGKDVIGAHPSVSYTPEVAVWEVSGSGSSAESRLAYGTNRVQPMQLLDWALNGKTAAVYDETWSEGRTVRTRNVAESMAAAEKMRALDDRFGLWVWEDEERAERIATEYNRRFNSHVARKADGSHLTFPGMSDGVNLWKHQRDAVDRILSQDRTLIGHPVGSGKTLEMIAAAMTLKRMGLANKPMITVPNHLLEQIAREARQAYPTGKFLIAGKEDLAKDARRLFAARCATGDWDAIVITHNAFTSLPLSPEAETRWLEDQKAELREGIQRQDRFGSSRGPKALARAVRALETRLASLRDNVADPDQVMFEQLGIDYIMVDEAHLFRRLSTGSTSRDSGFSTGSSKRATDMLMKVENLSDRYPGKPIVSMFTGTPWSNTLAETWVWSRYLQPDALDSAGVLAFEPWVATFVRYENAIEVAPDGNGFRMNRRPVGMKNLPELNTMLSMVADIVSAEQIGLERPTHTVHNLVADPAPQQLDFVKGLAERADCVRGGGKVSRPDGQGDDSMLLVCNDGRKVALDPKLVDLDESSPKVAQVATEMAKIYHRDANRVYGQSSVTGSLQLALLDLGTPHPGDSRVYGQLRTLLVNAGVPAGKVRFVHDAKTDKARAHMFAQCREGAVSVLIGSTSKVGIGTNVQTRLAALFHIDAPWTPAGVEQREGRALRPRNLAAHVDIFRCVTESTFDAYTWQALERKARSFAALYAADPTVREVEDIGGVALSYGEVKALAAGNPLLLEQANVAAEVRRLQLMRSVHRQGINRAKQLARDCTARAKSLRYEAEHSDSVAEVAAPSGGLGSKISMELAEAISKLTKPGHRYSDSYRGLSLRIVDGRGFRRGSVVVGMHYSYHRLSEVVFTPKQARAGAEAVSTRLAETVDAWIDAAPNRARMNRETADQLDAEATQHETASNRAVFDEESTLAAAAAKLASIEQEIAASADDVTLAA